MTSQFFDMASSSNVFDVLLFLFSHLFTGPSFMSISSLVLELWQFPFIRDWPEILKSEIPPWELCQISGDWGKLGIPYLAQRFLNKILLLNAAKCYSFYFSLVIKGKPTGVVKLSSLSNNWLCDIFTFGKSFQVFAFFSSIACYLNCTVKHKHDTKNYKK